MRITNNMLTQSLITNIETSENQMYTLQNQISSGIKLTQPSDDPVGAQRAIQLQSNISSVNQWSSNADNALGIMNTTDGTLGDMTSMLQQVKSLAVEGSTGTMTTSDTGAVAVEVGQLSQQIQALANTQVGSTYIFSGTATDKELIPTDGSASQANGTSVTMDVGNNLSIPISVNGLALFGDGTSTSGSGGVLDTLNKLSTALASNDTTTVSSLLGTLDININNVIAQRADLGARTNRVTAVQNQLSATTLTLQDNLSNIQGTDVAQAMTDFTNQQNTYKAALAVGAQIMQVSLVDYMK